MTEFASIDRLPCLLHVPTGIIEHWCEHPGCEKWGCFGEPYGKETRWFCGEHKDREP